MNRRRFLATLTGAVIAPHLPKPAPLISPGEVLFFLDPAEFAAPQEVGGEGEVLLEEDHDHFKGGSKMRAPLQYTVSTDAIYLRLAMNLYRSAPENDTVIVGFKAED